MRSLLLESSPILSTPSRLFEEQYTVVSGVPGMGLTFWLDEVRGQRVALHTGHMPGHRTGFYLFPDAGIGVVLYYNTDRKVLRSFLDRTASFAFGDTGPVSPVAAPPNSLRSYEGRYRHSWYPHHHFGKTSALLGLEGAEMEVRADGDHLMVDGDRLQQAEDDVFASRVSQKCFGFIRNKRRQITGFYSGGRDRFEKIALLETRLARPHSKSLSSVRFKVLRHGRTSLWLAGFGFQVAGAADEQVLSGHRRGLLHNTHICRCLEAYSSRGAFFSELQSGQIQAACSSSSRRRFFISMMRQKL